MRTGHQRKHVRRPAVGAFALGPRHSAVLVVLASVGFTISVYLTYAHHRLQAEAGWQSLCAIDDRVNCDKVISSSVGSIFGVPLSLVGAWFYLVVGVFVMRARRRRPHSLPRSAAAVLVVASMSAVVLSLILAAVSAMIGAICLLCASLYVVNIGLLLTSRHAHGATGERLWSALESEHQYWRTHGTTALWQGFFVLAPLLAVGLVYSWSFGGGFCEQVARAKRSNPMEPLSLAVYIDFQCPHCRKLDRELRRFRGVSGIRIVPHQYPLDRTCNPRIKGIGHIGACLQSRAAMCAAAQGRYDELSDRLFDGGLTDEEGIIGLADELGLDRPSFTACLNSEETERGLEQDIDTARTRGVKGTPTVFINGERYAGAVRAEDLECLTRLMASSPRSSTAAAEERSIPAR